MNTLTIFLASGLGSLLAGLIIWLIKTLGGESIKERFDIRRVNRMEKNEILDEMLKIISEGESVRWSIASKDSGKHLSIVANKAKQLFPEENLGEILKDYTQSWSLLTFIGRDPDDRGKRAIKEYFKIRKVLAKKNKDLKELINRLRTKGK